MESSKLVLIENKEKKKFFRTGNGIGNNLIRLDEIVEINKRPKSLNVEFKNKTTGVYTYQNNDLRDADFELFLKALER